MTKSDDKVVPLSPRQQEPEPAKAEKSSYQWMREYFDKIMHDLAADGHTPNNEVLFALTQVLLSWIDAARGRDRESDIEIALALGAVVSGLNDCQRRFIQGLTDRKPRELGDK